MKKNKRNLSLKKKISLKKSLLLSSMIGLLVVIPTTVTASVVVMNNENIDFEGKKFRNQNEIVNYIKRNSDKNSYQVEKNNSYWSLKIGNKEYKYNSPAELQNALSEQFNIKLDTNSYITTTDINKLELYANSNTASGEIVNDGFWKFLAKDDININNVQTKIYQTSKDEISYNVEEATKSYYQPQSAFQFNGYYFNTKADLEEYLKKHYFINKPESVESIIIKAPDGTESAPININEKSAIVLIKSFVENNMYSTIQYNSSKDGLITLNKDNLRENFDKINLKDLQYIHIQSNQGKSRYVIDNDKSDPHNLMGPYFYQGNLDVGAFMNKDMWRKSTNLSNQVWQEGKIDIMIGEFFTSIINDDNTLNMQENSMENKVPTIFRTLMPGIKNKDISLDEEYLNDLRNEAPTVYSDVMEILINLMKSKKFNTFYKLPIMYSSILQRLVLNGAGKKIINITINYFTKIANYLQAALESIILDQSLLINSVGKKFNVKEFFGIGNSEFDLNVNIEYFMDELKKSYPKLVTSMVVYLEALSNITLMAGLIPFRGNDNSFLFKEFSLISEQEYFANEQKFENIYNVYSSLDFSNDFVKKYVESSTLKEVQEIKKLDQATWEAELGKVFVANNIPLSIFLKTVVAKNTVEYIFSKNALEVEIEKYINENFIVPGGMLEQLGSALPSFINGIKGNSEIDPYVSYLAIIADMRNGAVVFKTHDEIANPTQLIHNVATFAATSLITAGLVATTINNLYWEKILTVDWNGGILKPLVSIRFDTIKQCIRNTYWRIADTFAAFKNKTKIVSYYLDSDIGNITINKPSKVSSFNFFWNLDKVVGILEIGAPILGASFFLLEVALLAYNIFKETRETIYYVYTTPDGKEFVWDGGEIISRYLGFEIKETSTIEQMKLVKPVEYVLPQVQEFYYYNGNRYYSEDELKSTQLEYIFSNHYENDIDRFKKKFGFDKTNGTSSNLAYDTFEEMMNAILNDIGIQTNNEGVITSININKESRYLSNVSFKWNGTNTDIWGKISLVVKNILDNIRPTWFTKLPETKDGNAIPSVENNKVLIPGIVWTPTRIINNSSESSKYIVDNSANEMSNKNIDWEKLNSNDYKNPNAYNATIESEKQLYNNFKSKFSISSKYALNNDLTNNVVNPKNVYSKLDSNFKTVNIYTVKIPGKLDAMFFDRDKANKYIEAYTNIKKNKSTYIETSYLYNGIYFKNENEIRKWVKNYSQNGI